MLTLGRFLLTTVRFFADLFGTFLRLPGLEGLGRLFGDFLAVFGPVGRETAIDRGQGRNTIVACLLTIHVFFS